MPKEFFISLLYDKQIFTKRAKMGGYVLDLNNPVEFLDASKDCIVIRINGYPTPWKAPRVSSYGTYAPHGEMKRFLRRKIGLIYKGEKLRNAVTCDLSFYLPVSKTEEKNHKKLRALGNPIYHTKKPDRINLGKFAEDLLEGSILHNDSQIIGGTVNKEYVPPNGFPCTIIALFIHSAR